MGGRSILTICIPFLLVLAVGISSTAYAGGDQEYLKLMVTDCDDQPLDNARIEVEIYHVNSGFTDVVRGYTSDGYVEFYLRDLDCGDELRVTIKPSTGNGIDSDHEYEYVGACIDGPEVWDLGGQPSYCPDVWWERGEVIQAVFSTDN
jgi:hypothetical protein